MLNDPLTSELRRIIECPYPASLATLAERLTHTKGQQICTSIYQFSPCAISKLATIVYQALPLWSYTFQVLSSLCQSPEFRDTFLLQNPEFLDALLGKAVSSQRDFEEYHEACVLLLSRPLPAAIPLPSSAQSFFLQAFKNARHAPTVNTLKPVYQMLNGACQNILRVLPFEQRQRFDEELCHILSSSNGAKQDFTLPLWCFGIVLCAENPEESIPKYDSSTIIEKLSDGSLPGKTWSSASGRMLFGSTSKLHKTINLTYLSVIWAIKGDVGMLDEEVLEGIQIAIRTFHFIDGAVLKAWPASSALARNTFPKLLSKLQRTGINPIVQIKALAVHAMVAPEGSLPSDTLLRFEECLSSMASGTISRDLAQAIVASFPFYAPQIQESTLQSVVHGILDACLSTSTQSPFSENIALLDTITATMVTCTTLKAKLLSALLTDAMQRKTLELLRLDPPKEISVCCTYSTFEQWRLHSAVIATLLTSAFASQATELSFPFALTTCLIRKQRQLASRPIECHHSTIAHKARGLSLYQQANTPYTGQHLDDWRQRLDSELESQSTHQRNLIARSVAQICQDLETRCNTIEEPLRREKAKCQELEGRLHRLSEEVTSLESQAADGRFQLDGLEDEKLFLQDEKDSLIVKLDDLQCKYLTANEEAAKTLRSTKEHFDAREIELRSMLLRHEESLRVRTGEVTEHSDTITRMQGELSGLREQQHDLQQLYDELERCYTHTKETLEGERERNKAQQNESRQLQQNKNTLEDNLHSLQAQFETATANLSSLKSEFHELLQSSEAVRRDLEAKYINDMAIATTSAEQEKASFNAQLESSLQTGRQCQADFEESRRELCSLQETILPLEARLEELSEMCSEQEEELSELRTWRNKVLVSIGLDGQASLTIRPASYNTKEGPINSATFPPCEHRRRKSALQMNQHGITRIGTDKTTALPHTDTNTHSSQESTPKRAKPRTMLQIPSLQNPIVEKSILTSKIPSKQVSSGKRSALRQMSPNRRHTTVGLASSKHEEAKKPQEAQSRRPRGGSFKAHEPPPDVDMVSFFAGTPLTPGSFATGTARVPFDEEEDGTMTEL